MWQAGQQGAAQGKPGAGTAPEDAGLSGAAWAHNEQGVTRDDRQGEASHQGGPAAGYTQGEVANVKQGAACGGGGHQGVRRCVGAESGSQEVGRVSMGGLASTGSGGGAGLKRGGRPREHASGGQCWLRAGWLAKGGWVPHHLSIPSLTRCAWQVYDGDPVALPSCFLLSTIFSCCCCCCCCCCGGGCCAGWELVS